MNVIQNVIPSLMPNIGSRTQSITITEISNIWTLLDNAQISLSNIEVLHNQCSNDKLKKLLKDIRDNSTLKMIEDFTGLLSNTKIQPPSTFRKRDMSSENYQKNDAMLTDGEIANIVGAGLIGALSFINAGMVQTSNSSMALTYLKYYNSTAQYMAKLMDLEKEASWLSIPPTLRNIKQ